MQIQTSNNSILATGTGARFPRLSDSSALKRWMSMHRRINVRGAYPSEQMIDVPHQVIVETVARLKGGA